MLVQSLDATFELLLLAVSHWFWLSSFKWNTIINTLVLLFKRRGRLFLFPFDRIIWFWIIWRWWTASTFLLNNCLWLVLYLNLVIILWLVLGVPWRTIIWFLSAWVLLWEGLLWFVFWLRGWLHFIRDCI